MAAKRNDGAGLILLAIGACAILLLVFWPYVVGSALAQGMGAAEDSLAARVVGSLFEAVYLAVIAAGWLVLRGKRKVKAAATARDLAIANLRSQIREEQGRINLLESVRLQMKSAPAGEPDQRIPARERLLMELSRVQLVEPRVQVRGTAPVPTYIRAGTLLVSDRAIRHLAGQGKVEWRFDKIYEQYDGAGEMVTWAVSNRQKVSGVGGSVSITDAVRCLLAWAEDYPAAPTRALSMVDALIRAAKARVEDLQSELAKLATPEHVTVPSGVAESRLLRPAVVGGVVGALVFGGMVGMTSAASSDDDGGGGTSGHRASTDDTVPGGDDAGDEDAPVVPLGEKSDEPRRDPKPRKYVVARVVDGDTIKLGNGETVRLVGIDAPESGRCGSQRATNALADLVELEMVTLGESDEDRDQYDRLLRYVDVRGVDAGLRLIKKGLAVARYDSRDGYGRHPRERVYVGADRQSENSECAPPPLPKPPKQFVDPPSNCAPGYSPCIPPYPPDLDCADTGPVTVTGSDPHGLDADNDGVACGGD